MTELSDARISTPIPSLERFVRSAVAIRDPQLHRAPAKRFLSEAPVEETVEGLRRLMANVDQAGYRPAYHAVVHFLQLRPEVQYARLGALYREAHRVGYEPVRYVLLQAPPVMIANPEDVLPDPELLEVPLGIRKTMARGQERDMLTRLALDPSPPVVDILLQNPRFVEADVVRVAARRPNLAVIIETIARHRRWSQRYAVQHALAQNPYTPTSLAASFAPFMNGVHLRELGNDARLHVAVRSTAQVIGRWRKERGRGLRRARSSSSDAEVSS